MEVLNLMACPTLYNNVGQQAEVVVSFTLYGTYKKADNISHEKCGDIDDIQIKSARATVCKGRNISAYLENDGAKRFAYVVKDFSRMYIMAKAEYIEFVEKFGTLTRESSKNGGTEKIRLKHESKEMLEWLGARA